MQTGSMLALLMSVLLADPLIVAHRGAAGHRPEHTAAAYRLAIEQGADAIEPDLVVTKDGVLIARHDVLLAQVELADGAIRRVDGRPVVVEATTNVAEHAAFADRVAVRRLDGVLVGGWFADDFTLAEVRTLRARERLPAVRPANAAYVDEPILTFAEVLAIAAEGKVGVYPETKHPTYLARRGFDTTALAVQELKRSGFGGPVWLQSFEPSNLLRARTLLAEAGVEAKLIQLIGATDGRTPPATAFGVPFDLWSGGLAGAPFGPKATYADLVSDAGLDWLAKHVDGIGPWAADLMPRTVGPDGPQLTGAVAPWLAKARARGLEVHAYTLRAEPPFRVRDESGALLTVEQEGQRLVDAGVTGLFVEQPERFGK